jgi:small-conductance mechanosensitive channel
MQEIESDKHFELGDNVLIITFRMSIIGKVVSVGLNSAKFESIRGNTVIISKSLMTRSTITNLSSEEKYKQISTECAMIKERVAEVP